MINVTILEKGKLNHATIKQKTEKQDEMRPCNRHINLTDAIDSSGLLFFRQLTEKIHVFLSSYCHRCPTTQLLLPLSCSSQQRCSRSSPSFFGQAAWITVPRFFFLE